ncbi:hypothetical protein [Amycolatopsis nigrescens]|uniref:hypothetical protein n=1 Tax=Amycolatopsis nigrescens TaxID=381445 RepID=UPI00039F4127|nr:hypothetical protein [Amycolatopsis nigrescens]
MIERDRLLLARVSRVNKHLGEVVVELMRHQDGGELPPGGTRELGARLYSLGVELLERAEELEGGVPAPGPFRWWRSNTDLRVHAWQAPSLALIPVALCGHYVPVSKVSGSADGEPCISCARLAGVTDLIPAWAKNLPRSPGPA